MNSPDQRPDEDLALAYSQGDLAAGEALARRYVAGIYDFALRVTLDPGAADAAVVGALRRVGTEFSDRPDTLLFSSWVYGLVRDEALTGIRRRTQSENAAEEMPPTPIVVQDSRFTALEQYPEPPGAATWAWQAARGQRPRDYSILDLLVRRRLTPEEVGDIAALSHNGVYAVIGRLRGVFEEGYAAAALAEAGRKACGELDAIVASNPALGPATRREIARHIEGCPKCIATRESLPPAADVFAALQNVPYPPDTWGRIRSALFLAEAAPAAGAEEEAEAAAAEDEAALGPPVDEAEAAGPEADAAEPDDQAADLEDDAAAAAAAAAVSTVGLPPDEESPAGDLEDDEAADSVVAAAETEAPAPETPVQPSLTEQALARADDTSDSPFGEPEQPEQPDFLVPPRPAPLTAGEEEPPPEDEREEAGVLTPLAAGGGGGLFGGPPQGEGIPLLDGKWGNYFKYGGLAFITIIAGYLGLALGDSIQGSSDGTAVAPLPTADASLDVETCSDAPVTMPLGSSVNLVLTDVADGFEITGASIVPESAAASLANLRAVPQADRTLAVQALPVTDAAGTLAEYRLIVTLAQGTETVTVECTVLVDGGPAPAPDNTPSPTQTPAAVATSTPVPAPPAPAATQPAAVPTNTPTQAPPPPTATNSPTVTGTPPTATPTIIFTRTPTPLPTSTSTVGPTATFTQVVPITPTSTP